jgi:hypothetical protein
VVCPGVADIAAPNSTGQLPQLRKAHQANSERNMVFVLFFDAWVPGDQSGAFSSGQNAAETLTKPAPSSASGISPMETPP